MGLLNKRTQPVTGAMSISDAQINAIIAAIQAGVTNQLVTLATAQLNSLLAGMALKPTGALVAAADVHAPASNTAAVVAYTGLAGVAHVISGIAFGYDTDPTGGLLTITSGGATVFSVPITKSGAGFIPFTPPKLSAVAADLTITLAAGGAGCTGKVSVLGHWMV